MSQHDLTIDNQTFPLTRTDLNLALKALSECQSGASEPTHKANGVLWLDTTADPNILKMYNSGAPSNWITIGEFNVASGIFTTALLDNLTATVNAKAPLASPALTGTPTAPTSAFGLQTTQLATTALVTGGTTSALATTSGATVDQAIPAGVQRITVLCNAVSGTGTGVHKIRVGPSSTPVSTGYLGNSVTFTNVDQVDITVPTDGFDLIIARNDAFSCTAVLTRATVGSNLWFEEHKGVFIVGGAVTKSFSGSGQITLAGELDVVQLVAATAFDAGEFYVRWE